ncbi:protein phosphatase 1 regulatory subunit 12C isoform X2 [Polypterus senegalus]|uniref:protein phosphatase 1 regulatory subunit 12C isoform X2 n=1 Tax=Polypterus senegalus TaxID=55291 RepID=UPI001964620D|nr:protein phosphatase 1 regulatory subunit 12C isoform X2 [Polypterus senegalus]
MADGGAVSAAKAKRREQLKRWVGSTTDQQPSVPRRRRLEHSSVSNSGVVVSVEEDEAAESELAGKKRRKTRRSVRFDRAAEFLAACASGDAEEAAEMLREAEMSESEPAVIDSTNADGITALHQACIDENLEMVQFLVEHGANVNQSDNEGWTPLHVAASCGYSDIAEYLLQHGANVGAVNCDGDIPVDIAEEEGTEQLLKEYIRKQEVDVAAVKRLEEEQMFQDAQQWLCRGFIPSNIRHPKTGAGPLHVAAAKGYLDVMRLLLQCGFDVGDQDRDGWTPLHAAAHWGQAEACRLLAERMCPMDALSNAGQTPFDVAEENLQTLLTELKQKQADIQSQKAAAVEKQGSLDSSLEQVSSTSSKNRRTSVCRMSSKEKISVQDQSKERKTLEVISVGEDEGSSSSESERSENYTQQSPEMNGSTSLNTCASSTYSNSSSCADASATKMIKENQEARTARVQPTPSRRIFCQQNSENSCEGLKSDVYSSTQRSTGDSNQNIQSPTSDGMERRKSYQTPVRDEESESQRKARSRLMRQSRRSTQGVTLTDLKEAEKTITGKANDLVVPAEVQLSRYCSMDKNDTDHSLQYSQLERPIQSISPVVTVTQAERDVGLIGSSTEEPEGDAQSRLARRRGRKERRPTGMVQLLKGEENKELADQESSNGLAGNSLGNGNRLIPSNGIFCMNDEDQNLPGPDYKKLYETVLKENERLRDQLQEAELQLSQNKVELERATQKQELSAERPALLELERFERRALERKATELEEELKVLADLRADNQRLKDENAALIRVISKLSK